MDIGRRRFPTAVPALGSLVAARPSAQPGSASDPLGVRADFPAAVEHLYLDSAYIAPTPRPVVEAGRLFAESTASDAALPRKARSSVTRVTGAAVRLSGAQRSV